MNWRDLSDEHMKKRKLTHKDAKATLEPPHQSKDKMVVTVSKIDTTKKTKQIN